MSGRGALRRLRFLPQSLRLVYRASPRLCTLVLVLESTASAVALGQVLVVGLLIGALLSRSGTSAASPLPTLAAFAAVTLLGSLLAVVSSNAQRLLGDRVYGSVLRQTLAVAGAAPLSAFDTAEFSERLHRIEENSATRPFLLAKSVASLLGASLTSLLLVGFLVSIHWLLPVLAVVAGLPLVWASRRASRREYDFAVGISPHARWRHYLARLVTDRASAKEVRAYALAPWLVDWHAAEHERFSQRLRAHLTGQAVTQAAASFGGAVLLAATLGVLVLLVVRDEVSLEAAAAAAVALRTLAARSQAAAGSSSTIYESGLFLADLDDFLHGDTAAVAARGHRTAPPPVDPLDRLTLRGVAFRYEQAEQPAVTDVDLDLERGRVVAVVGGNGSGKTTLAKVASLLYPPGAGEVLWNGRALTDDEVAGARQHIAVLFQDFGRYGFSASDNVVLGTDPTSDGPAEAQVRARRDAAADAAGASGLVERLVSGWDTPLAAEYGGQDLSLGQWQRLALARACFRGASLVILDEPTASLDPRAEARLFDDVRTVFPGSAVLLITHRLTSARGADAVVVMRAGRVVETGTHDELLAADGEYSLLWNLQAAGYAVDTGAGLDEASSV